MTGECDSSDEASSERRDSNPASTTASSVMKQTSGTGSGESGEETTEVTPLLGHDNNSEADVWEPPARRPVIVVSDGLLSDRVDVEPASGVSDLVSSASVAGAVALALIVMAAVTVLVTHRRNRRAADPSLESSVRGTSLTEALTSLCECHNLNSQPCHFTDCAWLRTSGPRWHSLHATSSLTRGCVSSY